MQYIVAHQYFLVPIYLYLEMNLHRCLEDHDFALPQLLSLIFLDAKAMFQNTKKDNHERYYGQRQRQYRELTIRPFRIDLIS